MTIQHNGKRFTPEEWEQIQKADGFEAGDREIAEEALNRRNENAPDVGEGQTYFEDDGQGLASMDKIDGALKTIDEVEKEKAAERAAAAAPKPSKSAEPVRTSSAPDRNDPKLEAKWAEMRKERELKNAAMQAANEAGAAKRRELLASGMYYDDGRGNIRRRKKDMYIDFGGRGKPTTRDIHAYDWQTALDIQKAKQDAYNGVIQAAQAENAAKSAAKTQEVVAANKAALEAKKAQDAERARDVAKENLSIYDGMVAAFGALGDSEIQDEEKTVWGGKDAQGRDARWKYDEQGRIVGQADARQEKTGRRFKTGFVAKDVLDTINSNLQMRGNKKFRITGMMARQGVDAIDNLTGEPIFYVQGLRADGRKFMRKMTAKDVYRFGVENGEKSGLSHDEAEANVIGSMGDLFGVGKRKSAPTEKERIAAAELAGKERIAQMQYGTPMQRQVAELREEERLLQQSLYNKDGTPVEMSDEERAQIEGQMRAIRQARLAMMGFGVQTPGANAEAPRAPSPVISKEQAARAIAAREELAKRKAAEQQSAQPQTVAEKPMEQPMQTEKPAEAPAKPAQTSAKPSKSGRRQPWVQKPDKELRQEIDEAHRIINENSAIILDRMNGSSSDDEEWIVEGINALKKRADQGELSDSDISYLRSIMKVVDRRKNSWRSRSSKQDERPAGKPNMAPQMM